MARTYAMLDLEFTSLDKLEAKITQFGIVIFTSKYATLDYWQIECPVAESQWSPETLKWAKETYTERQLASMVVGVVPGYWTAYQAKRYEFISAIQNYLLDAIQVWGLKDFYLIANHPEVDITILSNNLKEFGLTLPTFYRNHKDMDSLMMGRAGKDYDSDWADKKAADAKLDKTVAHTALADCYSQIELLKFFNVELPE